MSFHEVVLNVASGWLNDKITLGSALVLIACGLTVLYRRVLRWKVRAVFDERERLAQELHDTLAQSFAGLGFQLEVIRHSVPRDSINIHRQLDSAADLVRHSHEEARRSITALRHQTLEAGDLAGALALCAKRLVEGGKVEIYSFSSGDIRPISLPVIDSLFRIGQEALANAVSHADAKKISIQLDHKPEEIELLVYDDGHGFSDSEQPRGFGIDGMHNRTKRLGGLISVTNRPAGGTMVKVQVPLPKQPTVLNWPEIVVHSMRGRKVYGADTK